MPPMPSVPKATPSVPLESELAHKEKDLADDIYTLVGRNVKFNLPSSSVIGEARASLRRPTRPYTPVHELRSRNLVAKEQAEGLFGESLDSDHRPYRRKVEVDPKKKIPRRLAPLRPQSTSESADNGILPTPSPSANQLPPKHSDRIRATDCDAAVPLKSWEKRAVDTIVKRMGSEKLPSDRASHPLSYQSQLHGSFPLDGPEYGEMLESECDGPMDWTVSGWDSKISVSETGGLTTVPLDYPFRGDNLQDSFASEASKVVQSTTSTPGSFPAEYLSHIEPPMDNDPTWLELVDCLNELKTSAFSLFEADSTNGTSWEVKNSSIEIEKQKELFSNASAILRKMQWLQSSSECLLSRDKDRQDYVVRFLVRNLEHPVKPCQAIGVCAILLRVANDGRILLRCCEILFRISKVEENDVYLRWHKAIDAINSLIDRKFEFAIHSKSRDQMDTLIYAVGAMKNIFAGQLSDPSDLQYGRVLASMIQTVLERTSESDVPLTQLLVQITGALRNLCALDQPSASTMKFFKSFEDSDGSERINYLTSLISLLNDRNGFTDNWELVLNVSRILSLLSMDTECLRNITDNTDVFHSLHQLAVNFQTSQPLLVRILFILGNLTSDQTLLDKLGDGGKDWAMAVKEDAVALFGIYAQSEWESTNESECQDTETNHSVRTPLNGQQTSEGENRSSAREEWNAFMQNEELLVKLIRFIANLSTFPEVGNAMMEMIELEMLADILAASDVSKHEELVLNVVGALANLSYYSRFGASDEGWLLDRGSVLVKQAVLGASRVFANISHRKEIAEQVVALRGVEVFTILLDHSCREIVYQVCGVLMNLFGSKTETTRQMIVEAVKIENGIHKIVDVIEKGTEESDWELVSLACGTAYNLMRIIPPTSSGQEEELGSYQQLKSALDEVLSKSAQGSLLESADNYSYTESEIVARRLKGMLTTWAIH
ncbi:hypothetical protein BJ742DRAFT_767954 [Cladochytrium replicatum]|nr:hypothetical protein BJ742DRAFT_767954 [Cladochytrium replicatum]